MDSRPLAVVCGNQYAVYDPVSLPAGPVAGGELAGGHWGNVITLAATLHECRAIWIAAYPDGVMLDHAWWHPAERGAWWPHPTGPQGYGPATVARVRRHDRPYERDRFVYDATLDEAGRSRDSRWQFGGVPADDLAGVVLDYEQAIGRTAGYSPAHDALAVLLDLHHGDAGRLASDPGPVRPADQAPRYCRALTDQDAGAWVHVYDVNAAYLAAANTELGLGEPEEYAYTDDRHAYVRTAAGTPGTPLARAGWYHEASLRAYEWAATIIRPDVVNTHEAAYCCWPAYRAVLRSWAAHYWQARQSCTTDAARAAVKSAYTAAIGRFAVPDKQWYRPHWRGAIIAEQARRRWTDAAKLAAAGYPPLLISTDTIALVHDGTPEQAAGPLRLGNFPGGYKHVQALPITPGLAADLRRGDERLTKRVLEIG